MTTPSAIRAIEIIMLKRMRDGPVWLRTFSRFKPIREGLERKGLAKRIKPPGGIYANMIEITPKGIAYLEE